MAPVSPEKARISGVTAKLVLNSKIEEAVPQYQQAIRCACVYGEKAKLKR